MEKKNTVFASGDSLLDMPILNMANYSIAPTHGEIYKTYDKIDTIEFTDESGILCAEEIIKKVELKIGEF
jgi:hydroxymethylpyrimidine pyrophosphatase-like HAD family hydrolase